MSAECRWIYRPGTFKSHWAFATCDKENKYLSKLPECEPYIGVADMYNGRNCPNCGKPIRMDYLIIEED